MRTTLAIDDDVLVAAKAIAQRRRSTIGEVISELARQSLGRSAMATERNGIPLLTPKPGSKRVTLEVVNAIRDETA